MDGCGGLWLNGFEICFRSEETLSICNVRSLQLASVKVRILVSPISHWADSISTWLIGSTVAS